MIERNDAYAVISYKDHRVTNDNLRVRWDAWDGRRFATFDEANTFLTDPATADLFRGATVIEVLDEIRHLIPATART